MYVVGDYLMTTLAMVFFNIIRFEWFVTLKWSSSIEDFLMTPPVLRGIIFIPLAMLIIYYLSGYYYNVTFRSRIEEFFNTLFSTFVGSVIIYFVVVANDMIEERGEIFDLIMCLWAVMFACLYAVRLMITLLVVRRAQYAREGFPTLIVGTSRSAASLAYELNTLRTPVGFNVVGFVTTADIDAAETNIASETGLPVYDLAELNDVCTELEIRNVIVMPHHHGVHATMELLNQVYPTGCAIYISPFLFQLISGKARYGNVAGEPLVNISHPGISAMTACCKRAADLAISALALILLMPLLIGIAIAIKCDSRGPVFYKQERIGFRKRLFNIIKFRTMYPDAEPDGPALSAPDDPRVTRLGRFLRKYRLDELPQFYNILRGDMSLVGPRPERQFYVDQIVKRVPYYSMLHTVRPGLTSLGMVKYGYAMEVDEMIERLKYDLMYLENMSMLLDLKIILYTIRTVLTGKGV